VPRQDRLDEFDKLLGINGFQRHHLRKDARPVNGADPSGNQ
jgi:hypothetical protein